jgi:Tol biopolymer transport system component/DNA-binding winged helix-turn-helix (wHTH) protein
MSQQIPAGCRSYSFGAYRLDTRRRLLWREDVIVSLTPKTLEVLSVLVEHHGRVIGKDELLRCVWPNAVVEENNLARHISTLRKALQQRRGQHDFISTIPGRGYMFVAAVSEVEDDDRARTILEPIAIANPATTQGAAIVHQTVENIHAATVEPAARPDPVSPAVGMARPAVRAAVAATLAIAATAAVFFALSRKAEPRPGIAVELRQLTFDQGTQSEPAWSPDGVWLAYAGDRGGNLDIYRRSINDPTPVRLTSGPADESQPDWSPDGRWLAFRSEADGGGIYVMPAAGGALRRVSPFGYFPRWSPDGSRILFRGSMLRGIDSGAFLVRSDGTELTTLRPDVIDRFRAPHVAWHPDGRRVSIGGRLRGSGWGFVTAAISGGGSTVSPLSARFAEDLRRQDVTFGRFVWSKSGRYLYLEGRSPDAQGIWRVQVEPGTLAWKTRPERMSTGPGQYADLALSGDASRLAFTVRNERTRVWSFPFAPELGMVTGEGRPVTPGGPAEYDVAAPLDGSKVAYRTSRGGRQELWQRSVAGDDERLLASGDNALRSSPRWSRDGTRLAYQRSNVGGSHATAARAVAIVPAGGGPEQLLELPPDAEVVPDDWSSDGSLILAACRLSSAEPLGTCVLPSSGDAVSDLKVVASDPSKSLMCQRFSPDERWISFMAVDRARPGVSTIYVMPIGGGGWIPLTSGDMYDDKPRWSPDGRILYYISPRGGVLNLWGRRFDPASGKALGEPFRVTSFHATGPTLAPDLGRVEIAISNDRLFVPITESIGSIWMLEGLDR